MGRISSHRLLQQIQLLQQEKTQVTNDLQGIQNALSDACDKLHTLIPEVPSQFQPSLRAILLLMLVHIPERPALTTFMTKGQLLTARSRLSEDVFPVAKIHESPNRDEGLTVADTKIIMSFIDAHSYVSPKSSSLTTFFLCMTFL
jgi:hypothetical protein